MNLFGLFLLGQSPDSIGGGGQGVASHIKAGTWWNEAAVQYGVNKDTTLIDFDVAVGV